MTPSVTIAIASDLHCHSLTSENQASFLVADSLRTPSGKHPVEALAELIDQESLSAELLLCPGDITDKVCIQGLNSGWDFLKEIRDDLRADFLVATLGNHDVDSRSVHSADPFQVCRGFRPREFPSNDPEAGNYFGEKSSLSIQRLRAAYWSSIALEGTLVPRKPNGAL